MKHTRWLLAYCLILSGLGFRAQADTDSAACLACHTAVSRPAVEALQQSVHRPRGNDGNAPAPSCVSCHGPSLEHRTSPGTGEQGSDVRFGNQATASDAEQQNRACLACHQGRGQIHWPDSPHNREGIKCVDCHRIHQAAAPAADKRAAVEACTGCHVRQGAETHYASAHPLRDGQMQCHDCHDPHGDSTTGSSVLGLASATCLRCHADLRGPFLWEHPPVSESCALCHVPHGSPHPALLAARAPWLCQQCHLTEFHPSSVYSGTGMAGTSRPSGAQALLARNCMNCHPQVHGSNHPSGARLTR